MLDLMSLIHSQIHISPHSEISRILFSISKTNWLILVKIYHQYSISRLMFSFINISHQEIETYRGTSGHHHRRLQPPAQPSTGRQLLLPTASWGAASPHVSRCWPPAFHPIHLSLEISISRIQTHVHIKSRSVCCVLAFGFYFLSSLFFLQQ